MRIEIQEFEDKLLKARKQRIKKLDAMRIQREDLSQKAEKMSEE